MSAKQDPVKKGSLFLVCSGIFIVNLILKLLHVYDRPVSLDEPFSIFFAQLPPAEISRELMKGNNPPLYELLLHYWTTLFGISSLSVRFPSILASSATAVVVFLTGRRFFNPVAAWTAAILFTASTFQFHYANEARMYAMFGLFTALSVHQFLCLFDKPEKRKHMIWLTVVNSLLVYTHYIGFLLLATEGIICLLFIRKSQLLFSYLKSCLVLILLFSPLIGSFITRSRALAAGDTWMSAPEGGRTFLLMLHNFTQGWEMETLFLAILCFGILLHLFFERKNLTELRRASKLLIVFLLFAIPFSGMFLLSGKVPLFYDRYLLFTSIPLYLSMAAAIYYLFSVLPMRELSYIPAVIVVFFFISHTELNPAGLYERQMDKAVAKVKELQLKEAGLCTVVYPFWSDKAFGYHYSKDIFSDFRNFHERLNDELIYPVWDVKAADSATRKSDRFLYLRDELAIGDTLSDAIYNTFRKDAELKESFFYPPCTHIFYFQKSSKLYEHRSDQRITL